MKFCPECGSAVGFDRLQPDVPTDHYYYSCVRGHRWEVTVDKSGELLHIAPISEEQEGGGTDAAEQTCSYRKVGGGWESFDRFVLQGFPNIGPTLASSILVEFGKVPLSWNCTLEELKSVPGMGERRAEALWKLLE